MWNSTLSLANIRPQLGMLSESESRHRSGSFTCDSNGNRNLVKISKVVVWLAAPNEIWYCICVVECA